MSSQSSIQPLFAEQAVPYAFEPHWVDTNFGDRVWSSTPINVMMAIHDSARMAMDALENVWFRAGPQSTEIDRDQVTYKLSQRVDDRMNVATMFIHGGEIDRLVGFLKRMTVQERYKVLQQSDTACAMIDRGIKAEDVLSFYPSQVKSAAAKVLGERMIQKATYREHTLSWDAAQALALLYKMEQNDSLFALKAEGIFALMDGGQPVEDIINVYPEALRRGLVRNLADILQEKIKGRSYTMNDVSRCVYLERFHTVLAANYYGAAYHRGITSEQYYEWLEKHGHMTGGKFNPRQDAAPC